MAKKDAMQGLCLPRATCGNTQLTQLKQLATFNAALTIKIIIIIFKLICKLPNRTRTEPQPSRTQPYQRERERDIST